jgi:hypothetical protein
MRRARWFALFVAVFALAVPPLGANAATPSISIVMRNLNNPRGLNFATNGALFVAEAGRGGTQQCFVGPEGQEFAGLTGSVSRLWHGTQERIVTGMPSHAAEGGFGALGPHDVLPRGNGRTDVTIGLGTDPAQRSLCAPIGKDFGWLVRTQGNGGWRTSVDIAAYEARANPDNGAVDSNPYGLLASKDDEDGRDGGAMIATDAGGNSLLAIKGKSITTLATFPSRPSRSTDAVPTSVARGPDGTLYVGELTGFPFVPGTANIYRIGKSPLTGFSFVVDIAFGPDGSLYVLEFASGPFLSGPGNLWRVNPATPTGTRTLVPTGPLIAPTSVTVGDDGALYISNCGVFPAGNRADDPPPCQAGGGGHVLRVKV